MKKLFLKIYDFFDKKRWICVSLLVLLLGLFAFLAFRIEYEEDIAKFLPKGENRQKYSKTLEQLATQKTIAVFFTSKDSSDVNNIVASMDDFAERMENCSLLDNFTATVDQTQMFDLLEAVCTHIPYLMTDEDYVRIDSLLKQPNFIENQLEEDKKLLMLPSSGTFMQTVSYDPLRLFSPLLQKLNNLKINDNFTIIDDYLFTADGKRGIITFETPFGANESKNNAQLSKYINEEISEICSENPDIEIVAVGAPFIAVSNAERIKKDSFVAVAIAIVLIFLILIIHYKRFSDILFVGISMLFGVLFALACLSLFKSSVSVIVLGIGSVIIGIAANYPLHFLDDYKELGDRRAALKEMILPLLIGNITTVAAFFCLVWLDAQAMRDLGLFGALMLVGTIFFVLVFLPHLIRRRPTPSEKRVFAAISDLNLSRSKFSPYFVALICILTVIFGYFSTKTSFDSNLSHINYMTPEERSQMQLLTDLQSSDVMYAVAEGSSLQEVVNNNNLLINDIRTADKNAVVSGLSDFLPSETEMAAATERWNNFWREKSREDFVTNFDRIANSKGFSVTAFHPFTSMLSSTIETPDIEDFNDFIQPFLDKYVFISDNSYRIINYVQSDRRAEIHDAVDGKNDDFYVFSASDMGNQLVEMLQNSFNYIGWVCSIVVFIFLLISFRRIELAILAFLPLAISWIWILGIMHLSDIQFNIVNIILATFIFGQGDDYTIFITEGLLYEYTTGKERLASYKHSVLISVLIMFAGIGCLIFAKHPALHSLATVTIIGMLTVVLMASFVPPVIFDFLTKKNGELRFAPITLKRAVYSLIYGGTFVIFSLFIVTPYTFFYFLLGNNSEKRKLKYHKKLQKIARFFAYHTLGAKFSVDNSSNEDFSKPAVIIANHQSHLDVLYILSLSPKIIFLTNERVWNNPLYSYVLRKAECYPVSDGFDKNFERLKDLYERGYSICLFPEGTRSPKCEILRFHKGAFSLARALDADILPLIIHGAGHVLPKTELMLCEGSASLKIMPRLRPQYDFQNAEISDIDRLTAQKMRKYYKENLAEISKEKETEKFLKIREYYSNYYKMDV